jgi:hypothetical protein
MIEHLSQDKRTRRAHRERDLTPVFSIPQTQVPTRGEFTPRQREQRRGLELIQHESNSKGRDIQMLDPTEPRTGLYNTSRGSRPTHEIAATIPILGPQPYIARPPAPPSSTTSTATLSTNKPSIQQQTLATAPGPCTWQIGAPTKTSAATIPSPTTMPRKQRRTPRPQPSKPVKQTSNSSTRRPTSARTRRYRTRRRRSSASQRKWRALHVRCDRGPSLYGGYDVSEAECGAALAKNPLLGIVLCHQMAAKNGIGAVGTD